MSFDPNTLPDSARPEWATYIQQRSPKFKTHANRGQALQAAAYYSRTCQIFHWDFEKDEWAEVWNGVVDDRSVTRGERCERCGGSTIVEKAFHRSTGYGGHEQGVRRYNDGSVGWLASDSNKKKLIEPFTRAWLCRKCK